MLTPVILSRDPGTCLSPLPRENVPDQLLALCGQRTVQQGTVRRVAGFDDGNDGHALDGSDAARVFTPI